MMRDPCRVIPGTAGLEPEHFDLRAECQRIGVTRLADLTALDIIGLPVTQAVRPASKSLSVSLGRGNTVASAKLSAFGEAFELYCAENADGAATFSTGEFLATGAFSGVESVVPRSTVSFNLEEAPCNNTTATGLGVHPHIQLAIRHGIYECQERHLYSLWRRSTESQRQICLIDPESINEDAGLGVVRHLKALGFDVLISNIAPNMSVAAYVVELLAENIEGSMVPYSQGLACHADSAIALYRALTEAVQTRMAYISGAREDLSAYDFFGRLPELFEHRRGVHLHSRTAKSYRHLPCHPSREIPRIAKAIHDLGLGEPRYVDLSPAGSQLSAVKVLLPDSLDDLGEEQSPSCLAQ